jgi:DNA-binding NarL/FixJ family response regulator
VRLRAPDVPEAAPPEGSRVSRFRVGEDEIVVLSFPMLEPELPASLTSAERAVLELLLRGRSNGQIAAARGTSTRTVANQVASIFRKLGVSSRAELSSKLSK